MNNTEYLTIFNVLLAIGQVFLAYKQLERKPNIVLEYYNGTWLIKNIGNGSLYNGSCKIINIGYFDSCFIDFYIHGFNEFENIFVGKINNIYELPTIPPNSSISIDYLLLGKGKLSEKLVNEKNGFEEAYKKLSEYQLKESESYDYDQYLNMADEAAEYQYKQEFEKELNDFFIKTIGYLSLEITGKGGYIEKSEYRIS